MRTIPSNAARRGALALVAAARCAAATGASSQELAKDLAAKLTPEQRKVYLDYRKAKDQHEKRHTAYWARVEAKRDAKRAKRLLGQAYEAEDYIAQQPPKYAGPELPADIAKIVTEVKPPVPVTPLPTVSDFLAHAKALYGFVPTPTTEQDFKRRYAQEALAVGLTKDQVVRIYALETGGQGTYDMQAGFNPADQAGPGHLLGAGLCAAVARQLGRRAGQARGDVRPAPAGDGRAPGTPPERAEALRAKAAILRRMLRAARIGAQRVERARQVRRHAARPRHPRPQSRRRRRPLAAGAQAEGSQRRGRRGGAREPVGVARSS